MSVQTDTRRLSALIRKRFELVREIHLLTVAHPDLSSIEDVSVTLSLLSRKETIIDQLARVHSELLPFQAQDPDSRLWNSPSERQQCGELARQTEHLLQEIMTLDERNLHFMQHRRDAVAAQLSQGRDSQAAQRAYTAEDRLEQSTLDITD